MLLSSPLLIQLKDRTPDLPDEPRKMAGKREPYKHKRGPAQMMLRVGLKGEKEMLVERRHLTDTEALSTHSLVLLMELASRAAIDNCLPEGKMTVGTLIRIRHFGISSPGSKVRAVSFLREIQGRRLVFDVAAFDGSKKIAEGRNEQLIVSREKFLARIEKKADQMFLS
jgi:fluoroacetyl-CoA thioesterase